MKALSVVLNGRNVCVAGLENGGALAAQVFIHSDVHPPISLHVSGFRGKDLILWGQETLTAGDEIVVRVVETDSVDSPKEQVEWVEPPIFATHD